VARRRRSVRAWGARVAAPAAFLLAVTIAFLLIRAGLRGDDDGAKTVSVSVATVATTTSPTKTTPACRAARQARRRFYVIASGDTFGTVAQQFDTTVERLQALNPDASSNSLVVGQRIRVR
jgi:hypothetical protein